MNVDLMARRGKEAGTDRDSYVCKRDVVEIGKDKYEMGGCLV